MTVRALSAARIETGLDYFGARSYSAAQGRFTSPDPNMDFSSAISNPQAWNRYAYALNNPLCFIDPDGAAAVRAIMYLDGTIKSGGSRAWRNNNAGNLIAGPFATAHGAMEQDYGGQAIFPTPEAGEQAQEALWNTSSYQNLTVSDAIAKHAPPDENDTAA